MQQLLSSTRMPQLTCTRTITMQNTKKSSKMGITACYFLKRKNFQYSACCAVFCSGQFGWWEIAGAVFYLLNPLVDFMGGALQFVHTLHDRKLTPCACRSSQACICLWFSSCYCGYAWAAATCACRGFCLKPTMEMKQKVRPKILYAVPWDSVG